MIFAKNGNVGIGTSLPTLPSARLEVRGDIRLGSSGQFLAMGAEENLRTLRGIIAGTVNPQVFQGTGFTVTRTPGQPVGSYNVRFDAAFTDIPTVTVTPNHATKMIVGTIADYENDVVTVRIYNAAGQLEDNDFQFIAIGPR
jgi:hypothetical protein